MPQSTTRRLMLTAFPLTTLLIVIFTMTVLAQANNPSPSPTSTHTLIYPSHTSIGITTTVHLPMIMTPAEDCVYVEVNDAVVIELESVPPVEDWQLETAFPGFTGDGYYVWRGPDYFSEPGHGILTYPISLTKTSDYRLNIRNSHSTNPSLFNDVWVRLDNGPWIKSLSNIIDRWTFDFNFEQGGSIKAATFKNLTPGLHTLQLSGRSAGYRLDRLVLSANGMGQLPSWPESPCVVP